MSSKVIIYGSVKPLFIILKKLNLSPAFFTDFKSLLCFHIYYNIWTIFVNTKVTKLYNYNKIKK